MLPSVGSFNNGNMASDKKWALAKFTDIAHIHSAFAMPVIDVGVSRSTERWTRASRPSIRYYRLQMMSPFLFFEKPGNTSIMSPDLSITQPWVSLQNGTCFPGIGCHRNWVSRFLISWKTHISIVPKNPDVDGLSISFWRKRISCKKLERVIRHISIPCVAFLNIPCFYILPKRRAASTTNFSIIFKNILFSRIRNRLKTIICRLHKLNNTHPA